MCSAQVARPSQFRYAQYSVTRARVGTKNQPALAREANRGHANSKFIRAGAILALTAFFCICVAAQQTKPKKRAAKPAPAPAAPPAAAPFHAGETLDFTGEWLKISGTVTARLIAVDQRPFFGKPCWHLQTQLHTNNPLRVLFPVDDQFDSYSTAADLQGLQFEMYLHESGKEQTNLLRLSSGADAMSVPSGATIVRVLPGTHDPLGFLYELRTIDWNKTSDFRSPVFDGHNLYDVRAELATRSASTQVAAGTFTATGIAIHVLQRGVEMANTKLTLWIAQDAARTPVLLEMELPIGFGRLELVHAANQK